MSEATITDMRTETETAVLINIYNNQCAADVFAESSSEYREYHDHLDF